MAKRLTRPTKEMMQAVNAVIAGNKPKATQILKEHGLSRKELDTRVEFRDGEKYDLRPKSKRQPKKVTRRPSASATGTRPNGIASSVDGRTNVVTLVQLETRVGELLSQKPKAQVTKVRKAIAEVEVLRQKYEAAKAVLEM